MNDIFSILAARTSQKPGFSYGLPGGTTFGMDAGATGEFVVDESRMSVNFPFASGVRRDGVGDLLEIGGISLERHRVNPVILVDHGKNVQLPIGLAEDRDTKEYTVNLDAANKVATVNAFFYQSNVADYEHALFCEQLFDMVVNRIIRAGSIGYQVIRGVELPPDYQRGLPGGLHLQAVTMLEASLVVMPANMDTVMKALSGPICGKALSPYLVKSLAPYAAKKKAQLGYEGKSKSPYVNKTPAGTDVDSHSMKRGARSYIAMADLVSRDAPFLGRGDVEAVASAARDAEIANLLGEGSAPDPYAEYDAARARGDSQSGQIDQKMAVLRDVADEGDRIYEESRQLGDDHDRASLRSYDETLRQLNSRTPWGSHMEDYRQRQEQHGIDTWDTLADRQGYNSGRGHADKIGPEHHENLRNVASGDMDDLSRDAFADVLEEAGLSQGDFDLSPTFNVSQPPRETRDVRNMVKEEPQEYLQGFARGVTHRPKKDLDARRRKDIGEIDEKMAVRPDWVDEIFEEEDLGRRGELSDEEYDRLLEVENLNASRGLGMSPGENPVGVRRDLSDSHRRAVQIDQALKDPNVRTVARGYQGDELDIAAMADALLDAQQDLSASEVRMNWEGAADQIARRAQSGQIGEKMAVDPELLRNFRAQSNYMARPKEDRGPEPYSKEYDRLIRAGSDRMAHVSRRDHADTTAAHWDNNDQADTASNRLKNKVSTDMRGIANAVRDRSASLEDDSADLAAFRDILNESGFEDLSGKDDDFLRALSARLPEKSLPRVGKKSKSSRVHKTPVGTDLPTNVQDIGERDFENRVEVVSSRYPELTDDDVLDAAAASRDQTIGIIMGEEAPDAMTELMKIRDRRAKKTTLGEIDEKSLPRAGVKMPVRHDISDAGFSDFLQNQDSEDAVERTGIAARVRTRNNNAFTPGASPDNDKSDTDRHLHGRIHGYRHRGSIPDDVQDMISDYEAGDVALEKPVLEALASLGSPMFESGQDRPLTPYQQGFVRGVNHGKAIGETGVKMPVRPDWLPEVHEEYDLDALGQESLDHEQLERLMRVQNINAARELNLHGDPGETYAAARDMRDTRRRARDIDEALKAPNVRQVIAAHPDDPVAARAASDALLDAGLSELARQVRTNREGMADQAAARARGGNVSPPGEIDEKEIDAMVDAEIKAINKAAIHAYQRGEFPSMRDALAAYEGAEAATPQRLTTHQQHVDAMRAGKASRTRASNLANRAAYAERQADGPRYRGYAGNPGEGMTGDEEEAESFKELGHDGKAMSAFNELQGGALVPPAAFAGPKARKKTKNDKLTAARGEVRRKALLRQIEAAKALDAEPLLGEKDLDADAKMAVHKPSSDALMRQRSVRIGRGMSDDEATGLSIAGLPDLMGRTEAQRQNVLDTTDHFTGRVHADRIGISDPELSALLSASETDDLARMAAADWIEERGIDSEVPQNLRSRPHYARGFAEQATTGQKAVRRDLFRSALSHADSEDYRLHLYNQPFTPSADPDLDRWHTEAFTHGYLHARDEVGGSAPPEVQDMTSDYEAGDLSQEKPLVQYLSSVSTATSPKQEKLDKFDHGMLYRLAYDNVEGREREEGMDNDFFWGYGDKALLTGGEKDMPVVVMSSPDEKGLVALRKDGPNDGRYWKSHVSALKSLDDEFELKFLDGEDIDAAEPGEIGQKALELTDVGEKGWLGDFFSGRGERERTNAAWDDAISRMSQAKPTEGTSAPKQATTPKEAATPKQATTPKVKRPDRFSDFDVNVNDPKDSSRTKRSFRLPEGMEFVRDPNAPKSEHRVSYEGRTGTLRAPAGFRLQQRGGGSQAAGSDPSTDWENAPLVPDTKLDSPWNTRPKQRPTPEASSPSAKVDVSEIPTPDQWKVGRREPATTTPGLQEFRSRHDDEVLRHPTNVPASYGEGGVPAPESWYGGRPDLTSSAAGKAPKSQEQLIREQTARNQFPDLFEDPEETIRRVDEMRKGSTPTKVDLPPQKPVSQLRATASNRRSGQPFQAEANNQSNYGQLMQQIAGLARPAGGDKVQAPSPTNKLTGRQVSREREEEKSLDELVKELKNIAGSE